MAETYSATITDFSLSSSWSCTFAGVSGSEPKYIYGTPSTSNVTKTYTFADIPAGSTIVSATLTSDMSPGPYSGASINDLSVNGGTRSIWDSGVSWQGSENITSVIQSLINAGTKSVTVNYRFKANGGVGGSNYQSSTLSASLPYKTNKIDIVYNLPYSACTAPTSVSVSPTSTGKSTNVTLSWSGAVAGTNNAITGYQVYRSESATTGYTALGSKVVTTATSGSLAVTSHATNGSKYYYKVATIGTQSGYNSGQSSVYATLTTTWTNPTPPNSVTGSTNVAPGSTQTISWSGASGGTNNPITGYELYYSGDNYAAALKAGLSASTTSTSVTAHATSGSAYTYKVKVLSAQGGVMSTASYTMTSLRTNVTAPTTVTLSKNNVKPSEVVSVSWSGQANGTNNSITGYQIETSTNGTTYTKLADDTASPYPSITASATNGGKVYVRIVSVGQHNNATSSAVILTTTVTKPSAPSTVSVASGIDVLYSAQRTLSWSGASGGTNNGIEGYRVYRSVDGGAYTQLGADIITTATSGSLEVTAKASNGKHEYKVTTLGDTTVTAEQASAKSTAVGTLTTKVTSPTAPTASVPTNVAPGSTQSLSWSGATNGTNNDISTYNIYEKIGTGAWSTTPISDGASPYTVTADAANGGYKQYKIVAVGTSGRGNSPDSNIVTMTTTVGAPTAPTTVTVTSGTTTAATITDLAPNVDITLNWSGAGGGTNNTIKGYRIMRSVDGGTAAQVGTDVITTATSGSATVTTKNGNGSHVYTVITLGNTLSVNSVASTAKATATTVVRTPGAPTTVTVAGGEAVAPNTTKTLSWSGATAGKNNAIYGYQVFRSINGGAYAAFGNVIISSATSGTYSVTASGGSDTYTYKIQTLGSTLSINSAQSTVYGTLSTRKNKSTGALNKTLLTATGSESITVTITPQLSSYTHKVTWYIPATTYTSGELAVAENVVTNTYQVPQTWILATTKTTTTVEAKCKLETFDGTTSIGVNEYGFTVEVPPKSTFTLANLTLEINGASTNTATITAGYSGYKHNVTWYANATYKTKRAVAASATPSDTYAIPITWNTASPNSATYGISCTVETIKVTSDGDLSLGSNTIDFSATVPATIVPTVTSLTTAQVNAYWSLYVRTKSSCMLTPVAAGAYGSTIMTYEITWPTRNSSGVLTYAAGTTWTTPALNTAGSITFTVKVTDSRGRTATKAATAITVTNYNPPSITTASYIRANSAGTEDRANGTYIKNSGTFTYSAIGSNAITAKAYYRESGTTTWLPAAGTAITITNLAGSVTHGGGTILTTKTYQTKITLTDAFSTVENLGQISTVSRVFDVRETRAGFGRIASNDKEFAIPNDWKYTVGTSEVLHTGNYTTTVTPASIGAAATSHGYHVPTPQTANNAIYLRNDNTWQTITAAEIGAAATSHGNHVPTTQTANDAVYLRNDNTWQTITPAKIGAAEASHNHTSLTGFITISGGGATKNWRMSFNHDNYIFMQDGAATSTIRFYPDTGNVWFSGSLTGGTIPWARVSGAPTSYPASDVYAWAKAETKPSYTASEVGAAASSHSHGQSQVNVTVSGYGLSTQAITDYPSGLSVQYSGGTGTPSTYGQLITFNGNAARNFQLWNTKDSENLFIRNYRQGDAVWSEWRLFLHSGNYTSYVTPANIGAAASDHSHSYLPLSGGTLSGQLHANDYIYVRLPGHDHRAVIQTSTGGTNDALFGVALSGWAISDYLRVGQNLLKYVTNSGSTSYDILHSGNYTTHCTPNNIGAAAASHAHGALTPGNGLTGSAYTGAAQTWSIVSHAGTAGSIGTINVGATTIGVNLGTTSTTAAAGNHTHSYLPLSGGTVSGTLYVTSPTTLSTIAVRKIYAGTAAPSNATGANGDIYIQYTA